jgi:ABC-2 type transport system ATP-binding protein
MVVSTAVAADEAAVVRRRMADLAIEADGLVKTFGANRAVDGVDLAVRAGTVFGVLGPNGAGKTTTVRMLATLLRPDVGRAQVFGHDDVREPRAVRSLVGVTGQYASVDEDLSATENLMIFARLLGLSRGRAPTTAAACWRSSTWWRPRSGR